MKQIIITLIILLIFYFFYISIIYDPEWTHFIPSQFNNAEIEILPKIKGKKNKYINGIVNMDFIASKLGLFKTLSLYYKQQEIVDTLVPKTWIIKESLPEFKYLDFNNKFYILKKDIQQQQGLQLVGNYNDLMSYALNPDFVVLQEFLNDPFIIQDHVNSNVVVNRKINLRVYVLITVYLGQLRAFIFKDGFVYYTPDNFIYSINKDNMITSGYISRDVYDRNPLTLTDLQIYTESRKYNYQALWNIIKSKLTTILIPYYFAWNESNSDNNHYQIFGVDIEPNSTFSNVKILEFNKGPDLNAKDARDKALKDQMVKDSLEIVFNNNITDTQFQEL